LQGNGTLDVVSTSFTNAGTVNPGAAVGTLSILGSHPQVSSGTINVEIGGRTAGLEYDQLQISGKATLAGTLNIGLTNGFRPNGGDRFEVIRYGSNALAFDHINGLDLGGGLFLQPTFSTTNLVLVTVDTRPQVVFGWHRGAGFCDRGYYQPGASRVDPNRREHEFRGGFQFDFTRYDEFSGAVFPV